jgi:hypothetical protein
LGSRLTARGFKKPRTMKKFLIKIVVGEAVGIVVRMLLSNIINNIKDKRYEQKKKH